MGSSQSIDWANRPGMKPMALKLSFDPTEVGVSEKKDTLSEWGTILLLAGSILTFFWLFVWGIFYSTTTPSERVGTSRWSMALCTLLAIGATIGGGIAIATHDTSTNNFINTTFVDVNLTNYPIVGTTSFCDPLFLDGGYHNRYAEYCPDGYCLTPSYAVPSLCRDCMCFGWDRVTYANFIDQKYCGFSDENTAEGCVQKKDDGAKCDYNHECRSDNCGFLNGGHCK